MFPYGLQHADGQDAEENDDQHTDSYLIYPPYPGTEHQAYPPFQDPLAPNPPLSPTTSYHRPVPRPPYGFSIPNPPQYQEAGQQGYPTPFPSGATPGPQDPWPNPLYVPGGHPTLYDHVGDGGVPAAPSAYTRAPTYQVPSLNPHEPRQQGLRNERYQRESRRPTITQTSLAMPRARPIYPYNVPTHAPDHRHGIGGSMTDSYPGYYTHRNQEVHKHPSVNTRNIQQQRQPSYQQSSDQGPARPSTQTYLAQYLQSIPGTSRTSAGSSFTPRRSEEMEFSQASLEPIRQSDLRGLEADPQRDLVAVPPSNPPRSLLSDWPDRSESPATPGTDGSDDPDRDEYEPLPSTSSAPSTDDRWARFCVPYDVFLNPPDPVRHQLYHKIRREDWFVNQTQERPITGEEASRIPGLIPGESVLLAFYDRVPDAQNKTVMRCTICMQTNQDDHLYHRPDRARVHMRHHFELRPVPCTGECKVRHCRQRFFTNGDLNAHVAGKTEPLAKCQYCEKPLRAKNLQRHIDYFCDRATRRVRDERGGLNSGLTLSPPVIKVDSSADIRPGGRIIRLTISHVASEEVHTVWIRARATLGDIAKELSIMYQVDVPGSFVVLEADWGPEPRWNEGNPNSSIPDSCQILYVVFKRQSMRYVLGVVRDSLADFPICISITADAPSINISESIKTSHYKFSGNIRSITSYSSDEGNNQFDYQNIEVVPSSTLRTTIMITLNGIPDKFMSKLAYEPVPALLQFPSLYCEHLLQRAYALEVFPLQMIHLSTAIRHLVLFLANEMKGVFADEPSPLEALVSTESDLLQVAPILVHEMKIILDQINRIMDKLEESSFDLDNTQEEISAVFNTLCGEFPGAVTVRHSVKLFGRLSSIDYQETRALARDGVTGPPFTHTGSEMDSLQASARPMAKCQYCEKPLRAKNLQRHIDYFCHRTPPGVRRDRQD